MINSNLDSTKIVFSNPTNAKRVIHVSDNVINGMKKYFNIDAPKANYVSYKDHKDYRSRIKSLYSNLEGIKPIDNEIDNVLYLDNYLEKGLAVKPSISSLKQIWVEYRLMYNEYEKKKEGKKEMFGTEIYDSKKELKNLMEKQVATSSNNEIFKPVKNSYVLDNFDEIYDRLAKRVDGANKYIDDLKKMKEDLNQSNDALEIERRELEKERKDFNTYRQEEEKRLASEREKIEANSKKLQDLIDGFENKLNDIL